MKTTDRASFGTVLEWLEQGHRFCREGWNGKGMYIELQEPDKQSKMNRPYIFMKAANDELVPWVASQSDMLAHDWMLVEY